MFRVRLPHRPRSTRAQRAFLGGFLLRIALVPLALAIVVLVLYGARLDRTIRDKFEGQRWALPARVYARPLELYVGRPLSPAALVGELARIKYRAVPSPPERGGHYRREGDVFLIRTLGFRFWDGTEEPVMLRVRFNNGTITELKDAADGRDVALARLEPALIASIYPTHNEDRVLLTREQLPDLLVETLIAVEDRNFYQHFGLDPKGILRAAYRNLRAGRAVEGASTLTQQLVKNFYLDQQRTLERKFNEAYMAVLLERRYTKDEILTAYANEIYMGQDGSRAIHGFGLASRFYFDRELDELGIAETALLVAVLKGPSEFNPRRYPERALARRNLVIDTMIRQGLVPAEIAEAAKAAPLGLRSGGAQPAGDYPAFVQLVRRQLQRDYREEDLRSAGLNIFTTLDPLIQAEAEKAIRARLPELERQQRLGANTLEAAAVVTSLAQGEVLALVGARDPAVQGFNRALDAVRPIGSLIKVAIYLAALERPERYSVIAPIPDQPVSVRVGNRFWQPKNYDRRIHGMVPLYRALAKSYNLAAVRLGLEVGIPEVAAALTRLGALRPIETVPAMLLGSVSLTPLEVTQIYQTIAAGGFRTPLRAIREVLDADGRPLTRYPLAVEPVVASDAAYLTQWLLRKVVEQGTATWLKQRLPSGLVVAGKTGTTNQLRDSWFAGFTGDKVIVVWIGRDDNQTTKLTGSTGALRVWGDLVASLDTQPLAELVPETVILANVCGYRERIPFSRGHVGVGAACGATGAESVTRATEAREDDADNPEDAAVTDEMPLYQDSAPVPPSGRATPSDTDHEFSPDFYR